MKRAVSGIMLALLLMSMLTLAVDIQLVKASGTIYIRADGSVDPSTAPIQRDGDLYTLTGNITSDADGIVIERDSIMLDGAGYTVQGVAIEGSRGIDLTGRNNITIRNIKIKEFWDGIMVYESSRATICGNNITNTYFSIHVKYSWKCVLNENMLIDDESGPRLYFSASCSIFNNTISRQSYGVQMYGSDGNSIYNNKFSNASSVAIGIWQCNGNFVSDNIIEYCHYAIILGSRATDNLIVGNTITEADLGIQIQYKTNYNILYHNNLINNTCQVDIESESLNNIWDNGCEGNYWSNYNGTDTSTPSDGIGDEYLPWLGVDYFPLMNSYWNPADVNHDLKVDIYDVVLACNAYGSTPSDLNWNCHCDIDGDGDVDIYDIVILCNHYGETYQ